MVRWAGRSDSGELWVNGQGRIVSTVEVLAHAHALIGRVPVGALVDPQQWIVQADVLALAVTAGLIRSVAPGPAGENVVLRLDDVQTRQLVTT